MPIYEYECPSCGCFEHSQSIHDRALERCPKCRRKVQRLISASSFQLKGGGWYSDGYHKSATPKDGAGEAKSTTESKAAGETSSPADTKTKGSDTAAAAKSSAPAAADSSGPKTKKAKASATNTPD